jgi:ERCC4-type nuclease
MLLVDSREPRVLRQELLTRLPKDVVVQALDSADFVVLDKGGRAVGIERKTVSDLLSSLASPRLQSQTQRMVSTYPVRILLLEGEFALAEDGTLIVIGTHTIRPTKWSHAAYQMAILSLQHRQGFYVLSTSDLAGTVDTLRVLHSHIQARHMKGRDAA